MLKAFFNIGFTASTPPDKLSGRARAEYIARRNFYNLTSEYNYFTYTLNKNKVVKNANAEHYFTREGANGGLFDMNGVMSEEAVKEMKERLKTTKSIIWHGVISFDGETSKGFETQENAVKFLNRTFNAFLDRTPLNRKNICLYASLHKDTDHRHIHFAFFEKEPMRKYEDGIDYTRKGTISQKAIDNYLVSANMHLSEDGEEYYSVRDEAMERLNELRRKGLGRVKKDVRAEITELAKSLPKTGRLQYRSRNMDGYRERIDRVAELLIQSDPRSRENHVAMLKEFARVESEVKALAQDNRLGYVSGRRMSEEELRAVMDGDEKMPMKYVDLGQTDYLAKLKEDYKARVGNVILGMCKDLLRDVYFDRRRAFNKVCAEKMKARNYRKRRESVIGQTIKLLAETDKRTRTDYMKSVAELESEAASEKYASQSA